MKKKAADTFQQTTLLADNTFSRRHFQQTTLLADDTF